MNLRNSIAIIGAVYVLGNPGLQVWGDGTTAAANDVFGIHTGKIYPYKVVRDEESDYGDSHLYRMTIVVPRGMSKNDFERLLRMAVKKKVEATGADDIALTAYAEGTDVNTPYSAGIIDYEPKTGWGNSVHPSAIHDHKIIIKFDPTYFHKGSMSGLPKGFSLAKLKEIALEEGRGQNQIYAEVDDAYPDLPLGAQPQEIAKRSALQTAESSRRIEALDDKICRKYHITDLELASIKADADQNHWPQGLGL